MAPEILEGKQYKGSEVDIFALGTILFNVVTNFQHPFEVANAQDAKYKLLMDGRIDEYFAKFITRVKLSQEFKDLIVSLFQYDASKRPNIKQIRNSTWMKPLVTNVEGLEVT